MSEESLEAWEREYEPWEEKAGPVGNLIASLLFGIAEIELQHAKERQVAGIAVAKKRGVYTGRRQGTTKAAPAPRYFSSTSDISSTLQRAAL